jgi:hypothetical protein
MASQGAMRTALQAYWAMIAAAKVNTNDPATLKEALNSEDAPKWKEGIRAEYTQLKDKEAFEIVDRPKGIKVLRGRLVFKKKRDQYGNIMKYKARWVVKGYEQLYGRDYDQTYAGVRKSVTWKIIIAMAALQDWDIEQMDAVTAFLNSDIEGDVYMELPPGWGKCKTTPPRVSII